MLEVVFAVGVTLLALVSRGTMAGKPPIRVDMMELNHYEWTDGCDSHQVILRQWVAGDDRYVAMKFYFVSDLGNQAPRKVGGKWRFTCRDVWHRHQDIEFESDLLIETFTDYDPWRFENSEQFGHH